MEHTVMQLVLRVFDTFSGMVWQIYWPLAFGLMLSSALRHILPVDTVVKHLGQTSPKSLMLTTLLGMVSSSCSYAAASLSKTLLIKKASLSNAMAFLVASTNLILEMFVVLVCLLGWQFLWGEITGGILLVMLVAILFQFYPKSQLKALRNKLTAGSKVPMTDSCMHEMAEKTTKNTDHCNMAMSSTNEHQLAKPAAPLMDKIRHSAGFFQMDIKMIGKEILIGVVISSLLIALMPINWWRELFIGNQTGMPTMLDSLLDVVIGICVAILAYVCSVGNLLLAAALWHGGISFGGVMGFILADVLTIPMTRVYRHYYGKQPARWITGFLFIAILATGLLLDIMFSQFNWHNSRETVRQLHQAGFGLNLTTVLNIIFIPLSIWYYMLGRTTNDSKRSE